jgi:hypothetical protein
VRRLDPAPSGPTTSGPPSTTRRHRDRQRVFPTLKARSHDLDATAWTAWWGALLAPVLLVNAVAFSGQYAWANANLPRWDIALERGIGFNLTAAAFAAALESIAIYLQYEAHTALMAGDASFKLRLGSYAVALLAGVLNYWHWANPDHSPTPAAVAFGALSAISPWLWAVRSRSMHREQLREQGLVEQRAVKFATARWLLYPRRTFRAFRLAVWVGETDPLTAIALLGDEGKAETIHQAPDVIVHAQPVSEPVDELSASSMQAGPRLVPQLVTNESDQKVLAALNGKALGQTALSEASGVAPSTLKNAVKRLEAAGHVEKVGTLYRRRVVA